MQGGEIKKAMEGTDVIEASQQQALTGCKDQPLSFQVAVGDVLSREKIGTAQLSLKPWQEEPAARTGREASAMQADPCSASSRYVLGPHQP